MEGDILNGGDQVERSNQKEKDLFILLFCWRFFRGDVHVDMFGDFRFFAASQKRGSVDLSVVRIYD